MQPRFRLSIRPKFPPRHEMAGDWAGLRLGLGYEFWGLRKYVPGDSYAHIDWKARARTGELHVREYLRDSAFTLMLLVDGSPSMRFGGKYDLACAVAESLAHGAVAEGNPAGLVVFSDQVVTHLPPSADPRQPFRIAHALDLAPPQALRPTDAEPALRLVTRRVPSCLGVLLSDFLFDLGSLSGIAEAAARDRVPAHELVALHVLEPVEQGEAELGGASLVLRDAETGELRPLYGLGGVPGLQAALAGRIERLAALGVDSLALSVGDAKTPERINFFFARRPLARV